MARHLWFALRRVVSQYRTFGTGRGDACRRRPCQHQHWLNAAGVSIGSAFSFAGLGLAMHGSSFVDHEDSLQRIALCCGASMEIDNSTAQTNQTGGTFLLSDSYRRRIFFKYERRLRMLSPPEKVFDYFASIKAVDGQLFMTASDLMRAVVPVFPPSDSPLVREGSLRGERPPGELRCPPSKFFMLFDTNGDGLISFSEYIFLHTLLSIPESSFSTAVRMFDIDGNGTIDREEFQKVMGVMKSRTRKGAQRDSIRMGLRGEKSPENCGLVEFFFGSDGKKSLKHDDLILFLKELHEEIIRLEFSHYDYWNQGTISAKDFGLSMVAAADMLHLNHYLDCVDALGNDSSFEDCRLSFEVCNVSLTDKVVDIIFYIFDINKDGNLSTEEFLAVLERRERGMSECLDSGIVSYLKCWWRCACRCHI